MGWLGTWANRLKLTTDHERIGSDLSNFPLYITLTSGSGRNNFNAAVVFDELTVTGTEKKIAVTDSTGVNQLPVEIEYWDLDNRKAGIWAKVPTVYSGIDTVMYLYYDSGQLDNNLWVGETGTAPALDVWDDNFHGVWHLHGIPDNTAGSLKDSTDTGNHGTSVNMEATDSISEDKFLGINTDGSNEYVQCGNDSSLRLTSNFSAECVFKTTNLASDALVSKTDSGNTKGWGLKLRSAPEMYLGFKISNSHYTAFTGPTAFSTSDYYYIGFSYVGDGSNPTVVVNNWLENISIAGSAGSGGLNGLTDSAENFEIGTGNIFSSSPTYHTGPIIEVRYSNGARSADWMKATYYTIFDDLITYEPTPVFTASGTVTVDTILTDAIPVRLYRRTTGQLVGETTTVSGGQFEIETPFNESHYIMAMYTSSGTNAVIYDWIAP